MHCAWGAAPQAVLHSAEDSMKYDDSMPRYLILSGFALGALLGLSLALVAGPTRLRRTRRMFGRRLGA
jgi:hypothetical protein